jgi:hypothetical protein
MAASVENATLFQEHPQLKADVEKYFEKEKYRAKKEKT